jgi:hypothetical protein
MAEATGSERRRTQSTGTVAAAQLVGHDRADHPRFALPEDGVEDYDPPGPEEAGDVGVLLPGPAAGVGHEDLAHRHPGPAREGPEVPR